MQRASLSCAVLALFAVPSSSQESPARAESTAHPAREPSSADSFAWGDADGDGRLDLAIVGGAGELQLFRNAADGGFEDVTGEVGLGTVADAALVLWADYDGDKWSDLFVGAREGSSRLFRNEAGVFVDVSAACGLSSEGAVRSARWLDGDGDGRLDLFVVTAEQGRLFRGLAGGFFETSELPGTSALVPGTIRTGAARDASLPLDPASDSDDASEGMSDRANVARSDGGTRPSSERLGPGPSADGVTPLSGFPGGCADGLRDQANPGACLAASTVPALGQLHPLSEDLFVASGGEVGIGTTAPTAKLHVAGPARFSGKLTLDSGTDQALDVASGSISKSGALFIHTKGSSGNTGLGREALRIVSGGSYNTASGYRALYSNTNGNANTATGFRALFTNTGGNRNTASGARSLFSNTSGINNTASGFRALFSNTTGGNNTASGYRALYANSTASGNTADGTRALAANTTGSDNTASGFLALSANTAGNRNTASGFQALLANTTGDYNTASGFLALSSNVAGENNVASGSQALRLNTTGHFNTAVGVSALGASTTGNANIALGFEAGSSLTTGSNNIAIGNPGVGGESSTIRLGTSGTHTKTFLAGVRNVTTTFNNAIPVLIDGFGQLGTVTSSRRFKEEIRDMGEATERLLELRPVVFRYKQHVQGGDRTLEYGLIAEEVAEVFPDLVLSDEEGRPLTVKYHLLSSMLLNELKKQASVVEDLRDEVARLNGVERRLAALESRAQPSAPAAQLR